MDPYKNIFVESSCSHSSCASFRIERCPFLRNINEPTNFSFSSSTNMGIPVRGMRGPIFIDAPHFDIAFRLFHGRDGVDIPLSGPSSMRFHNLKSDSSQQFNPLAAKAATISMLGFGLGGALGFDSFSQNWKKKNNKKSKRSGDKSNHEFPTNEWFHKGQCPIAKSYCAISRVLPLVSNMIKPPPGVILRCPPAVAAARAALAETDFMKNLLPQSLSVTILSIGLLNMAANIPLGTWRENTVKFSPQWFVAIHVAVPSIVMLRKSVNMLKAAMAFTIAASFLGQTIESRAERIRLKAIDDERNAGGMADERNCSGLVVGPWEKSRLRCSDERVFDLISIESDFHGMGTVEKCSGICC